MQCHSIKTRCCLTLKGSLHLTLQNSCESSSRLHCSSDIPLRWRNEEGVNMAGHNVSVNVGSSPCAADTTRITTYLVPIISELLVPSPPDTDNNIHLNRGASPTQPPTNNPSVWAETKGMSTCRGPISAFVLPAGAGDWSWGATVALQDRIVNPEPVEPEG